MPTPLGSEDAILARIERAFPASHHLLPLGRGDDCAVLPDLSPLAVSTDLFMEDVHFRRRYFSPEDLGWKALAVNLSDLAAAGARPVAFTVGLALPPDADMELVDGILLGMKQLLAALGPAALSGDDEGLALAGGDLSRAEKLHFCLTVFGVSEAPGGSLRRAQARPGDCIFMVGRAGLARVGLLALEKDGPAASAEWPDACAAHLRPVPRLREGLRLAALAGQGFRIGLMDLSDGLARDLPRLLGPQLGAELTLPAPHPTLLRWAEHDMTQAGAPCPTLTPHQNLRDAAQRLAFLGGEDYALIGTCDARAAAQVMATLPESALLGHVTENPGLHCAGVNILEGFDHFSR